MPLTILANPEHLTRVDLLVAARTMLSRYERLDLNRVIEWCSARELDNLTVRLALNGTRTGPADADLSQEVLMAFFPDHHPRAISESLYRMGLRGQPLKDAAIASPDEDLHAGLFLLDHPDWFTPMACARISPQRIAPLVGIIDDEAIGLALDLGLDDDWFATAATDPDGVNAPGLRTLAALRPPRRPSGPFDRTPIRLT